ncbi:MAG: BON domain-containing protein [Pseudomonadota bacterium]
MSRPTESKKQMSRVDSDSSSRKATGSLNATPAASRADFIAQDQKCPLSEIKEDVSAAIEHVLEWIVGIPERQVQSSIDNGWVTLTGHVDLHYKRFHAQEAVSKLAGVRGVTNLIDVEPHAQSDGLN